MKTTTTTTFLFSLVLFVSTAAHAAVIGGTVTDAARQPLQGVAVELDGIRSTVTDAAGAFTFDVPAGAYTLRIAHPAFRAIARPVNAGDRVDIALQPELAETIVVSGIRAEAEIPVTKTNMSHEEIERRYHGQDIPLLLRDAPSINAYAESGLGSSGYSYITMRGIGATRINFTLDGVPLADSEDFGAYFVDFPDLARSIQSIQIQRGAGTSTVGSPSFGGSVNFESIDLAPESQTSADVVLGSFGTRSASVAHQTGFLPGGFALYSRLSFNESDGFRENSGIEQRNLFVSATKMNEHSQLKLTGFSGHEAQQLSFYATDEATLRENLRANPLVPEEKDSFGYDLAHLQYLRSLGDDSTMTASAYYQRGYGWYRLYDDNTTRTDLRQYGLDGLLFGTMATLSQTRGAWTTNYGIHVNRFEREHTRDLVDGPRDYFNYGVKGEANAFAKARYDAGRWHYYGDAQLRYTDFAYHGDVDIDPISWTFFNPRLGARYDVSPASSAYVSAGLSTREPTRNDMFLGEDNPSAAHDLHAVRPERVLDVEAGWEWRSSRASLTANLYAMEFRNEIAATGELSDIGLLLRRNVDRSYRRGIELDASWQVAPMVRLRTFANFSRNRIAKWTQFYDVYDADGNWVDSKPVTFRNVEPLLSPSAIVSQAVELTPSSRLTTGLTARYVSRAFLDNTNDRDFTTPSFLTVELNASYLISRWLRLGIQVNNAFNQPDLFPSGYSYQFLNRDATGGETFDGTSYFYPQATRHVVVTLNVKL